MIVEAFLQAVILGTTAIASLRAGSRALYSFTHDEIGMMDGPLILSPLDIAEIRRQGNSDGEVSPLWESTFAFSEAVKILHDEEQLHILDNIWKGNWRDDEVADKSYSLASPHKSAKHKLLLSNSDNRIPDEIALDKNSTADLSLVIADENKLKQWHSPRLISSLGKYFAKRAHDVIASGQAMKSICQELWKCHPLFGDHFLFKKLFLEDDHDEIELDEEDSDIDFDSYYSTLVNLPVLTEKEKDLIGIDGTNDENQEKFAHIKAFAPLAFSKLRKRFKIDEQAFLSSILESGPYVSFQSNSKGAARVGGFFFFTRDGAYMIKTIKKAEIKAILEMLPKYYTFMKRNAKRSLLTRFCGLYSIQLGAKDSHEEEDEKCFLIMNSVFPPEASQFISERFDLKGSTVGRECSKEERESKGSHAVLKDLDLLKEVEVMKSVSKSFQLPDCGLSIGPTAKAALLSQLRRDLGLLVECSVMDYSLLVGVVNMEVMEDNQTPVIVKDEIEKIMQINRSKTKSRAMKILSTLSTPIQQLGAPVKTICQATCNGVQSTLSTVLTLPFPYYGAGKCGVDGGCLSIINGHRLGKRAVYYMGVIDFLQPWSTQKVLENQFKGVIGYDKSAISCVDPKEYAERFLNFMDKVIT